MTALISWIGVDSRGPASLYIAGDSRITWLHGAQWDFGRKVFASRTTPQLFGYCGDVAFPSQILGQLVSLIDSGQAFPESEPPEVRIQYIIDILDRAMRNYPASERRDFAVLYAARVGEKMTATFDVRVMDWSAQAGWVVSTKAIPGQSDIVAALGNGTQGVQDALYQWNQSEARDTSRAVFGAFCDGIRSSPDPDTGGAPQLVGLYRIGPTREFGVVRDDRIYLNGMELEPRYVSDALECRNELFERCSAVTKRPLPDAQKQARPKRL